MSWLLPEALAFAGGAIYFFRGVWTVSRRGLSWGVVCAMRSLIGLWKGLCDFVCLFHSFMNTTELNAAARKAAKS